ncbi:peptidase A1 family protein [Abortiporus biennis]
MQLGISFTFLLTALLFLSGTQAAPVARRSPGTVTLPLKRVNQARGDLHPLVYLQQHINRSVKRHAHMTGRAVPSDAELELALRKRMESDDVLEKRYNRQGVNKNSAKSATLIGAVTGTNRAARKKGKGRKAGAAAAAGAAAGTAAGAASSSNSTASDTGAGFSQADLDAAQNGGLTTANTPTAGDSLGLDIEANDVGYIATVQMGTPPRDFKLLMDSGSADLWVGSENCQSQAGGDCGNHVFLGTQSSSSFVDTKKQFQVTYGSGQVAGTIVNDNLNVAGLELDGHVFGVADEESVDFSSNQTPFDGLMGLAQSSLSEQKTATPVEALASNGLIKDAITSYKISRVADGKNDGEITFGGLDSTKFDANALVTFANVNTQGFWEGSMTAVTVNGQDLGLQGRTAILDTGTTLIIAPPADAAAVHQAIPGSQSDGQGGFTIPCTTTATVALTFGGQSFDINTQDLLFAPVNANDLTGDCVSGISAGQIGGAKEWLVGDVFLKNAYFSTDVTNNQISLAKLV